MLLSADRLLTPATSLEPGWLLVAGDRVAGVGGGPPPRRPDLELGPVSVVPGFVDIHGHGGGGASYSDGPDAARTAVAAHRAAGTTSLVASLVTDSLDALAGTVRSLRPTVAEGLLVGLHLEGPWLSPHHAGAHDPALLRDPTAADVQRLLDAGEGAVRMVTLAPERPGGLAALAQVVAAGAVGAVGHTDATYDQTRAALDAGARVGTHLFNAMRGLHHREPGPSAALAEDPRALVEVIADGVHLHPAALRLAFRAKPGQVVLVTDAMAAAGAADGDYRLGNLSVVVRDSVARLAGSGAIAGSTLTMAGAVRYAVQVAGLPLPDVVRAATITPAAALGLPDVGRLEPGSLADLVVLDDDLAVVRVLHHGAWVTPAA